MAIAPIPLPRTARPGGYANPNTGGGPLGNLLGWNGNPFYDAFDSRRNMLMGLGADLLSGDWGRGGAMQGAQMDDAYATQQKAEAERQEQINQTTEWLRENYPQFADLPPDQGFQLAMKVMSEKQKGADAATFGLTPIYGVGPDGQPTIAQLSNQGGIQPVDLPEGFQVAKDPIRMDAGTHFVLLDPVTRQQIGVIPKEVRAEAAEQAGGTVEGRQAAEMAIQAPVQAANLQRLDAQTDNVIETVDKALGQVSWDTTGLVGQVMGNIAGTGAFNLRETAKTIKANLGFAELQAMRDASPTGGALGQVAIQELEALQSTLASLNPDQSDQQLIENLKKVRDLLERQKGYRRMAAEAKYGPVAPAPAQGAPVGGDIDTILGGYGL